MTSGIIACEVRRIAEQEVVYTNRDDKTYNDNPNRCSNTLEALVFLRACCILCSCHNFNLNLLVS